MDTDITTETEVTTVQDDDTEVVTLSKEDYEKLVQTNGSYKQELKELRALS